MNTPSETLIVFSCAPGEATLDETGNGKNGIFIENLLKQIATANKDIEEVFKSVSREVRLQTCGLQKPYRTSSLTEEVFLVTKYNPRAVIPTSDSSDFQKGTSRNRVESYRPRSEKGQIRKQEYDPRVRRSATPIRHRCVTEVGKKTHRIQASHSCSQNPIISQNYPTGTAPYAFTRNQGQNVFFRFS
jgi:uncharacterized caspase-like protein